MNMNRIKGTLKELKGKAKEKLGHVTNDDAKVVEGQSDQLKGKMQKGYGVVEEKVDKVVDKLTDTSKK